ncbi:hypothetical protein RB195_013703 [Necator americanus]|uniref:DUF5641 domain-containing protein n=1 Tax=Necator americanus TaxID=51031 RepID=A0ABR1DWX4_NECAM
MSEFESKTFCSAGFPQSSHPKERITKPNYPFERCGMDCMGPFNYKSIVSDENVIDYCANRPSFNFTASHSPWQGGIYERPVGIFKAAYKNAVGNDIETLKTLTAECTAICNSRPLNYVAEEKSCYPLRPIDFLRPTAIIATPRIDYNEQLEPCTDMQANLMELWEYTSEMLDCFWKRWKSEYLLALREQYKKSHKHPRLEEKSQPKLDDYVIIHDDSLKRGQWKLGQVTGSTNDFKRTVQLRLANRETITRPITDTPFAYQAANVCGAISAVTAKKRACFTDTTPSRKETSATTKLQSSSMRLLTIEAHRA